MKKRNLTYIDYQKYLDNAMSAKERHEFEKHMMQDAFDEEAFDGLQQLSGKQARNDMALLKNRIMERNRKKKPAIPFWMRYAAAAAIIIGFGLVSILYFYNNPKYDLDYSSTAGESFAIADTAGKRIQTEPITSVPLPPPTINDKTMEQAENPAKIEHTGKSAEILEHDFEREKVQKPAVADEEMELKEEKIPEPGIADEEMELNEEKMTEPDEALELAATPKEQSVASGNNIENTVGGDDVKPAAEKAKTKRKSTTRMRTANIKAENPAMAPRTDTHRAMPPVGLDYEQFQKQLTEETAKILEKHGEAATELTLTILIDKTGTVTEVRTKEPLTRKTTKELNSYMKKLGKWQPEIHDGVAKKSEQIINLNFE
ncbi:MAG: hypothetical protein R6U85_07370 [Salinivirgaceae bacterium]